MNKNNEEKKPYDALEELIETSARSIKRLDKKNKIIKIKTTIIMCSTVILAFTILRPIITFSLIGSSLINLGQAYNLKRKINNIKERKKAIGQINKFLNLDKKINRQYDTILNKIQINAGYRNDLYECIWTNDIKYLQNITQKYETKFIEDLTILNKKENDDKTSSYSTTTLSPINKSITTQKYSQPNLKKQPINGHQFVKKIF